MGNLNFDASQYASNTTAPDYSAWDIGKTGVVILSAEEGIGSTSGNPHYKIQIQALDGSNKDKKHRIYYVRKHPNENVIKYAKRDLANLVTACGLAGFNDIGELSGKLLTVEIGRRLDKHGEPQATFSKFYPYIPAVDNKFDPHVSSYGKVKDTAYISNKVLPPGDELLDDPIPF